MSPTLHGNLILIHCQLSILSSDVNSEQIYYIHNIRIVFTLVVQAV